MNLLIVILSLNLAAVSPEAHYPPEHTGCLDSSQKAAKNFYREAKYEQKIGRSDLAIVLLDKAIAKDGRYACAITARGILYAQFGNYQRSLTDLDRVVRLEPRSMFAYQNRGYLRLKMGDYRLAIKDLSEAVRLDPKHSDTYGDRGTAYAKVGCFAKAIADFTNQIHLAPNNSRAFYNRALTYQAMQKHKLAIADFRRAIELEPSLSEAWNGLCWEHATGDISSDASKRDCDSAVASFPSDPHVYNSRGLLRLRLKKFDQALRDFNISLKLDRTSASSLYGRGIARIETGDHAGWADVRNAVARDRKVASTFKAQGIAP